MYFKTNMCCQNHFRHCTVSIVQYVHAMWQCDSTNLVEYCDVLNEVKHICNREATQYFILGGDMNTDMSRNTPQTRTLCSFVEDEDLHLCIKSDCADVLFTFCSKSNGSKSSIDHLIVSQNLCEYINKYEAMFMNSDFSDHVPICLELNINVLHLQTKLRIQKTNVAWHNCSDVHIANYKIELDKQLECIDLFKNQAMC